MSNLLTLNQDYESLINIGLSTLSYDLSDRAFREYAHASGVLYKAGCGKRLDYYTIHCTDYSTFCKLFRYAQQHNNTKYEYAEHELSLHYEISLATRGALEDCYRLYKAS